MVITKKGLEKAFKKLLNDKSPYQEVEMIPLSYFRMTIKGLRARIEWLENQAKLCKDGLTAMALGHEYKRCCYVLESKLLKKKNEV